MMDQDSQLLHSALGILGNIASILFFLSSAPTAVRMVRLKSSEGLSGNLYAFKLFNCLMWMLYGMPFIHPRDFWVLLTNAFGFVFAVAYIVPYLLYAAKPDRVNLLCKLLFITTIFLSMAVLLLLLDHSQSNRILIVGVTCVVISSCMHMTLLSQCRELITSKDPKYLHPNSSIAAFIKGAIWTIYGVIDFDMYIIIPNGIGVLIGTIQVILVVFLVRSQTWESKSKESIQVLEGEKSRRNSSQHIVEIVTTPNNAFFNTNAPQYNESHVEHPIPSTRGPSFLSLPRQSSNLVVPINGSDY